jgi:hypothetical protein
MIAPFKVAAYVALAFSVARTIAVETWSGLSFDHPNFLCSQFDGLCDNFLDEMGCGSGTTDRVIIGCPGYPDVPNNITHYVGTCACNSPGENSLTRQGTIRRSKLRHRCPSRDTVPIRNTHPIMFIVSYVIRFHVVI